MDAIERIHEFDRFGMILGLERMNMLLDRLGHPEKDLKVIHVAGTNGKGSVCGNISAILEDAGFKCGKYISPNLISVNERISINGKNISNAELEAIGGISGKIEN